MPQLVSLLPRVLAPLYSGATDLQSRLDVNISYCSRLVAPLEFFSLPRLNDCYSLRETLLKI